MLENKLPMVMVICIAGLLLVMYIDKPYKWLALKKAATYT